MLDLLIRGGTVVDGTGSAPYAADVAVENGRIVEVGTLPGAHARRIISADGKLVTPGFIDIHRHADLAAWRPGFGQPELRQGLTTIVNGNCGLSAAPMRRAKRAEIAAYLQPICGEMPKQVPTDSLADFFAGQPEAPIHTGMLVGAGVLRASAAGYALEHLEDKHYKAIHRAMEQALADGALGVSLGLGYAPECFYTTQELIRALEPLTGQSIPVTVHMRQEGGGVLEALEEMLAVARALRIPVHISHLKAMGRDNWGVKIPRALAMLEKARQEGLEVGCDVYPYTAGSTQLIHILPPDFLTGGIEAVVQRLQDKGARRELAELIRRGDGFDDIAKLAGWDGIRLTSLHCPEDHPYQGKSIAEIAALWGQSGVCALLDRLDRAFPRWLAGSAVFRLFARDGAATRAWPGSITSAVMGGAANLPTALVRWIYRPCRKVLEGSFFWRLIALLGQSTALLTGLFLLVLLIALGLTACKQFSV